MWECQGLGYIYFSSQNKILIFFPLNLIFFHLNVHCMCCVNRANAVFVYKVFKNRTTKNNSEKRNANASYLNQYGTIPYPIDYSRKKQEKSIISSQVILSLINT